MIALVALTAAGCTIRPAEACGPNQVYLHESVVLEFAVCVCDENAGYVRDGQQGHGCRRCPDGDTVVAGACVAPAPDRGKEDSQDGSIGEASEPTGVGAFCESSAECASFDATYCSIPTSSCMVERCATGQNTCASESVCCDYSALLAGLSLCLQETDLADGNCPMGGKRVAQ